MAVRFRSVSTATNTEGTDALSVTVTQPSQLSEGDTMVAVTGGFDADTEFAAPAGWTFLGQAVDGTGLRSKAFKKTATASEPASEVWTFATSGVGGAINVSVAAFMGGHDVLQWNVVTTGTEDPANGHGSDAARDSVSWQVYCWRNSTANTTVSWNFGSEKHDITAKDVGTIRRGQSGMYFGPPTNNDIVNAGDEMPSANADPATAPTQGIFWNFLIGEKEPDNETWTSTDGAFDVDLKLDTVAINDTGSVTTALLGDITNDLAAATSSISFAETRAFDGLTSTHWFENATPGWLQYDFGAGVTKTVKRYRISSSAAFEERDPMDWTLKGSNNGVDFTVLDTRVNESFGNREETREFKLNGTPGAYRFYRLDVTKNASNNVSPTLRVAEFRLSDIDVWEDITEYVQEEQKIRITRGLQGTTGRSDHSRAYLTLKNTDGRFSIRNQAGKYFGALQRNTQMRISKAFGTKSLQLQGDVETAGTNMIGDGVRTALTNALSIKGDIDIRVDLEPETWYHEQALCGVTNGVADAVRNSPWTFQLNDDGKVTFTWTNDASGTVTVQSTTSVPQANRKAVRVTLDVDNGASGHVVTFYTADTIAGPWTQLGDAVTGTGVTDIDYYGGALCVGHVGSNTRRGVHGMAYHFELRNGIDGTLVSDVDFTALTNGAHTFTENSNNWITVNNAVISNRHYRFHGEVAEWPVAWDPTGTWVEASVTAAGIQRRLERGSSELSAMYRYHTKGIIQDPGFDFTRGTAFAYWPCEDEEDSFEIASGLPGKPSMQINGAPTFSNYDGFKESKQLPNVNQAKFGGRVAGNPRDFADIRWLISAPSGISNGANILTLYGSGGGAATTSLVRWALDYETTDTWRLRGFTEDDTGAIFRDSGNLSVSTAGELLHAQLILDQDGTTVDWTINVFDVFGDQVANHTGTFVGSKMGRIYRVNVNDDDAVKMDDVFVGHIAVYGFDSPAHGGGVLNAHHYETAADRIERICVEEEIEFRLVGSADTTGFMGYQTVDGAFSVMSSSAVTDGGYMIDPLDAFGIEYRTLRSTLNRPAHLTLDYDAGELSGDLLPVDDDSYITNRFTASRGGAGSATFELESGDLSTRQPPDGVGEYAGSQSFSLAHEGQCVDLSSWEVHKGTLDEEHYPRIELALENLRIAADTALTERILLLDVGKRVDITDTPSFLPAEDIRQIVIGYQEWFDNFQHNFTLNTIPERMFEIAQYGSDSRYDTAGSTTYQALDATQTTFLVATDTGPSWSTTADDFDVMVEGERMTVTSVVDDLTSDTSDTFDRANSMTSLGSTDGGVVQAWTQNAGTWGINGNAAYVSVPGNSMATVAGTADFEELAVTIPTWPSGEAWLNFRFTDTNNRMRWGGTLGNPAQVDVVTGGAVVRTEVADNDVTDFIMSVGDKLSVRATGTVFELFVNDRLALTITDNDQTGIRVGMQTQDINVRFNDFTFNSAISPQTFTVTRSVNGVVASHSSGADVRLYQAPYRGL